jgi:hypothetical protein
MSVFTASPAPEITLRGRGRGGGGGREGRGREGRGREDTTVSAEMYINKGFFPFFRFHTSHKPFKMSDLLEDKEVGGGRLGEDTAELPGLLVLCGVDANALDPERGEVGEIRPEGVLYLGGEKGGGERGEKGRGGERGRGNENGGEMGGEKKGGEGKRGAGEAERGRGGSTSFITC